MISSVPAVQLEISHESKAESLSTASSPNTQQTITLRLRSIREICHKALNDLTTIIFKYHNLQDPLSKKLISWGAPLVGEEVRNIENEDQLLNEARKSINELKTKILIDPIISTVIQKPVSLQEPVLLGEQFREKRQAEDYQKLCQYFNKPVSEIKPHFFAQEVMKWLSSLSEDLPEMNSKIENDFSISISSNPSENSNRVGVAQSSAMISSLFAGGVFAEQDNKTRFFLYLHAASTYETLESLRMIREEGLDSVIELLETQDKILEEEIELRVGITKKERETITEDLKARIETMKKYKENEINTLMMRADESQQRLDEAQIKMNTMHKQQLLHAQEIAQLRFANANLAYQIQNMPRPKKSRCIIS